MVDEIIVDEIHECLTSLQLHNNPEYYLRDVLRTISPADQLRLIDHDWDIAELSGAWD